MNVDYSYVQKTIDFIVKERLRAISDQILEDTFQAVCAYLKQFDEKIHNESMQKRNYAHLEFPTHFMENYHKMYRDAYIDHILHPLMRTLRASIVGIGYECAVTSDDFYGIMGLRVQWSCDVPTQEMKKLSSLI
jgi:hypothetical protein